MSDLYKLYAPLESKFSCPDTEMNPLKTTENRFIFSPTEVLHVPRRIEI